jgi:hypothetical protein
MLQSHLSLPLSARTSTLQALLHFQGSKQRQKDKSNPARFKIHSRIAFYQTACEVRNATMYCFALLYQGEILRNKGADLCTLHPLHQRNKLYAVLVSEMHIKRLKV